MKKCSHALMIAGMSLVLATGGISAAETGPNGSAPNAIERSTPLPPHPQMMSDYYYLVQRLKEAGKASRQEMMSSLHEERANPMFLLKGEELQSLETYIWLATWDDGVRKAVEEAGAEVTAEDPARYLLQAWIPLDKVEDVAGVAGVRQLRRPNYGIAAAGSVITEGDDILGTSFIRSLGTVNGCGVNVGIVSQGLFSPGGSATASQQGSNADPRIITGNLPPYNPNLPDASSQQGPVDCLYPQSPGELVPDAIDFSEVPSPLARFLGAVEVFPQSFTIHDVGEIDELDRNRLPEGAAMSEIVYDLAPGSRFFYSGVNTDVELSQRRQFLVNKGVDVIVDDMVFYGSGRLDGTSTISREAQKIVLEEDISYVTATGNYTQPPSDAGLSSAFATARRFPLFVNGMFSPAPGFNDSKFHNFSAGRNPQIIDRELTISPVNGAIDVILIWDDIWDDQNPRATDDLDLFLFDFLGVEGSNIIASSQNIQNGTGLPFERIAQRIPGGRHVLSISRKDISNSAPALFSLIILQGTVQANDTVYLTHGLAGNNGDALPPVITVGSVDAKIGIEQIDSTTVPGRTPGPGRAFDNSYLKWFTTQKTPSVVSYSNVRTQSIPQFNGSSAAAAHIGGLMSLLRHKFPSIQAYEYYDMLRQTEVPGFQDFPNASELLESEMALFGNSPRYLRVNGFDVFANLRDMMASPAARARSTMLPTFSDTVGWQQSPRIEPYNEPSFYQGQQGLEISPGGQGNVFGFWQTPLLTLPTEDGPSTELRTDQIYELTARVGTDESDPRLVPDFRLRLTSNMGDETSLMVVAGRNADNAPTSVGGKEYKLYFRPSDADVAEQGVRFALDLLHFNEHDNPDATLYLQDVSFRELPLP